MDRLLLGTSREIITPKVGCQLYGYSPDVFSEKINDDLTATAFFFLQGHKKAMMISLTVCEMKTSLCDEIREKISEQCDIPKENIMLCATHTHSGPNVAGSEGWGEIDKEYCEEIFVPRILSAAKKACENVKHVRMGYAFGDSFVGVNRRVILPDNTVDFGQNKWGCFNPCMTVVSFVDDDKNTVANIVHYGCHGTAAGPNHEITRDWSGIMTDALEEKSGGITAFFNGTMGDAGPRISNGKTTGNLEYVYELGEVAARDVLAIYDKIDEFRDVVLSSGELVAEIPLKPRMDIDEARLMYEKYRGESVNIGAVKRAYYESVIKAHLDGAENKESVGIGQTVVGVGALVFTGIPYEMFAQTGFRIDEEIAEKTVLCVSNTNGFEGYFATQDAVCRGGYEVEMFLYGKVQMFCDDADWHLFRSMTANVRKIVLEGE